MATAATASSTSNSKSYKDMIKEAIINLKDRNGSSRQAVKKYVHSNNEIKAANFDSLFNSALKKGVDVGDFLQPKGPSGPVKLNKKAAAIKETKAKKPSAKKASATAGPKKVTKKTPAKAKATTTTKKAAAPAKAAPKKVTKPKAKPATAAAKKAKAAPKKATKVAKK
ncbi:hypothetical protein I9W82_003368 [Candida metapsilosis]|uniref:Histone H1 n=1 Tax=Candida metapsilosis TaxID=273372 RepID=A0A8H8DC73_9ASCO|nr:hypothetical protein I9W82_003368 [Candida metapsilosis]